MKKKNKIILGVDPGTSAMGYGLLLQEGNDLKVLQLGIIHLHKYKDHAVKLRKIFERISSIIEEFLPDEMAIEAPFYGKNVQSMLKLGRAQGVAIAAALSRDIPVKEYAPKKIKQSVTGNGNASKEQVAGMLSHILQCKLEAKLLDATDALAAAYCHLNHENVMGKESSSWKSFISNNPKRLKK